MRYCTIRKLGAVKGMNKLVKLSMGDIVEDRLKGEQIGTYLVATFH